MLLLEKVQKYAPDIKDLKLGIGADMGEVLFLTVGSNDRLFPLVKGYCLDVSRFAAKMAINREHVLSLTECVNNALTNKVSSFVKVDYQPISGETIKCIKYYFPIIR
jgi:hypothetical protein